MGNDGKEPESVVSICYRENSLYGNSLYGESPVCDISPNLFSDDSP